MSNEDRIIWNKRYTEGAYAQRAHPSPLLSGLLEDGFFRQTTKAAGKLRALDLACGAGRNAIYLSGLGYTVDAVDISSVALARGAQAVREMAGQHQGLDIRWLEADLDSFVLEDEAYDVILMMRYVNEALTRKIHFALKPEGLFICEEHLNARYPRKELTGPADPAFRVHSGALLEWTADLRSLRCCERIMTDPDGRCAAVAQLLAQKKSRATLQSLLEQDHPLHANP